MSKVIAFVPVRKGSLSIIGKNIKPIAGKPLVYWSLVQLQKSSSIDEIVVATDGIEIERVVKSFNFSKLKIYNRLADNATSTASTESVMLEYLERNFCSPETIFCLVQATNPFINSQLIDNAMLKFGNGEFDSLLSCVRIKRFFWNESGESLNYDYTLRPRRQDFNGVLMENGAFYINRVKNILKTKNRLSGKIGIFEMPEYSSYELDEPDDWVIVEKLLEMHIKE